MNPSQAPKTAEPESNALLVAYLGDRDEACPRCGYNLRMLTGDRCPECGDRLRLRVGLVESRLGAYITALVGCCLGFGGALFFLILVLFKVPLHFWREELMPWIVLAQAGVTGVLLVLLLTRRTRFTKKSKASQWLLATVMCLITLCLSGWAFVIFKN